MKIKRTVGENIFDSLNVLLMILLMIITLYPFLYVGFASVSMPDQIIKHQGLLMKPLGFTLEAYKMVIKNPNIINGYKNTLVYMVTGTLINLVLTCLGAFVLSRKKLYWKKVIMILIIFTMFFNGGLIPSYLLVRSLNMRNTMWALLIPSAISTYNLIIMRTSFQSIPDSMEESAKIDGANDFTILLRIIIPLSGAVIAVMTLFYGVGHWNSWFSASIYLSDKKMYPLQLILREILISNSTVDMTTDVVSLDRAGIDKIIQYATIIVATIPILTVYPFLQKYFTKGVMIGALKG